MKSEEFNSFNYYCLWEIKLLTNTIEKNLHCIVKMRKHIIETHKEFNITNQILRSGTAIGALVREAEFAQSPQDFINKLSIALKEGNETYYWLNILHDTDYLSEEAFNSMLSDCNELIALLIASIKTTKQRTIK